VYCHACFHLTLTVAGGHWCAQTLLTVWASIKDAMAGMFGGGSASDGGASQSAAQVVGKLLERIMMLLRQSEALQPALRKLQALQSSVGGGVLGSAMEGARRAGSRGLIADEKAGCLCPLAYLGESGGL
jgi:hypothetical protein